MKSSGFTLIELLGVIVILTILSLITIPIIDGSLNKGKKGLLDVQKKQIINGLKNYYAENIEEYNSIDAEKCVKIEDLKTYGYLPSDINNPDNNTSIIDGCVCVTKTEGSIKYEVYLNSEKEC